MTESELSIRGEAVLPIMACGLRHLHARRHEPRGSESSGKGQKSQSVFEPFASGQRVKV